MLRKPSVSSMKSAGKFIGVIWILAFIYAIRAPIVNDIVTWDLNGKTFVTCTIADEYQDLIKYFVITDIVLLFIVPFILVVNCYGRIIYKLSRTISDLNIKQTEIADRQALKAINMLVILIALFTVCTASPMLLKMYVLYVGKFENLHFVENAVYMFSYSNSWFNLIVFAVFREDLREGFIGICCKPRRTPQDKKRIGKIAWAEKVQPNLTNLIHSKDIAGISELEQRRRALMMMEF